MDTLPDWVLAVIMLFCIALALLFAVLGFGVLRSALRALKHGTWVVGTVIEVKQIYHAGQVNSQKFSYQPIYEFAAPDGLLLRGEAGSYDHTNGTMVGSQQKILVDFEKPDIVYVSRWTRLVFGAVMLLFGLGCAAFLALWGTVAFQG
ncbi:DUF3592 domain-containing protein [Antarctobacter sp.]|uniref:DUF3592 domain-containing protein n=1 Tax=Antarctobacter sp. TaxID=1872577 RepID=UPI002B266BB0|nr:DUF3592 domain-containing protein [Antarctobacter sp.]